jgi:methyl-accepting chemotaxis protein
MEKKHPGRKIRNYFINKDFQLKMIYINFIYMSIFVGVTILAVLSPLIYDMFSPQDIEIQALAGETFRMLLIRSLPGILVVFTIFYIHQISLTHRICGPLVNFQNAFKKISTGNLTHKVILRPGDFLEDECENINEMIDGLASLASKLNAGHNELIVTLEDIMINTNDPAIKEKTARAIQVINEHLAPFKL